MPKLTMDEYRKGVIVTWCVNCKTERKMSKVKVFKDKYKINRTTIYECMKCGRRRKF